MLGKLIDAIFGCWHSHYSFPITDHTGVRRNAAALLTVSYVVCLDRGPGGGFQGLPAGTSHRRIPRLRPHTAASPAESARSPAAILQCDPESGGGQRRLWPWCLASSSPAPELSRRNSRKPADRIRLYTCTVRRGSQPRLQSHG